MLLSSEIRNTAILNAEIYDEIYDKINYNELPSSIIKMNRN